MIIERRTGSPRSSSSQSPPSRVCSTRYLSSPVSTIYIFTGWSGACRGTGTCTVPMTAATSVTASFEYYDLSTATPLPDPRRRHP